MANRIATAPYNFVSLPKGVLTSPIDNDAASDEERIVNYRQHVLAPNRLSGRIDLTIETLTSVFVGADAATETFFSPTGVPMIPGSTIRGTIKNLFKIVTCSAMRGGGEDYEDRHLYFRALGGKDNAAVMRKVYEKRAPKEYTEAGYLIRVEEEQQYYICPAEYDTVRDADSVKRNAGCIFWDAPRKGQVTCYTGKMQRKAHYTVHHAPNWQERIPVPADIIQDYRDDISRAGVNLLGKSVAKVDADAAAFTGDMAIDLVVPCFYQEENGQVQHFGFGRFYRIPYRQSVGDHVIGMGTARIDYTDALFGRKELWAGRLAFTDALAAGEVRSESAAYPKVLGEPKPTSMQLYLEQESGAQLAHWDTPNACIRGYKLYWHQKNKTKWQNDVQQATNVTKTRITPVQAGSVFHGSIRFERLSEDELGALLKVLHIGGNDLCCKIGKGKSIGLGSVRITARLIRTDTEDSYRRAFDSTGDWNRAEREEPMDVYIAAFDRELGERLDANVYNRYRNAMAELSHMLDWETTTIPDWEKKTRTMTIDDPDQPFQNRWILPNALEVKET